MGSSQNSNEQENFQQSLKIGIQSIPSNRNKECPYYFLNKGAFTFKKASRWNIAFAKSQDKAFHPYIIKWHTVEFLEKNFFSKDKDNENILAYDYINENNIRSICKQINQHDSHPLVEWRECVRHNNTFYIIYEYFDSQKLKTFLIYNYEKLKFLDKLYISHNIAEAIKCLHQENIVHQKLNCKNILINKDREIKLCGLGSLFYLGRHSNSKTLLNQKPDEMSKQIGVDPEDYCGKEKNQNLVSFGKILIALFSGRLKENDKNNEYDKYIESNIK